MKDFNEKWITEAESLRSYVFDHCPKRTTQAFYDAFDERTSTKSKIRCSYIYTVFPRMLTAVTISFRHREAANTKRGRMQY